MKQWYQALFENYAEKYDKESFTQGTVGECDFLEQEAEHNKAVRILDIGCGTGRHAIELTSRGYTVTGIDLSESQLSRAKEKARQQELQIDFQQQDARNLTFSSEFDLAIMLCEGAFALMETDEMNFEILRNAAKALTPSGKLIFTTLNGLYPLFHSVKDFMAAASKDDQHATYSDHSFDLMTFRDHNITHLEDDLGVQKELLSNERYYVPSEITWLLRSLQFNSIEIFGAKLGAFSRKDTLRTDDFEMLVIATK